MPTLPDDSLVVDSDATLARLPVQRGPLPLRDDSHILVDNTTRERFRTTLTRFLRQDGTRISGWGAHGVPDELIENIRVREVAPNREHPRVWTEEEALVLARSMVAHPLRQIEPIVVTPLADGDPDKALGYRVRVIDGEGRRVAALLTERSEFDPEERIQYLRARVIHDPETGQPLGTFHHMLYWLTSIQRRPPTVDELVIAIAQLRVAFNQLSEIHYEQTGNITNFPTQRELAETFGISQTNINVALRIADEPPVIYRAIVETGNGPRLLPTPLRNLIKNEPDVARRQRIVEIALELAADAGKPFVGNKLLEQAGQQLQPAYLNSPAIAAPRTLSGPATGHQLPEHVNYVMGLLQRVERGQMPLPSPSVMLAAFQLAANALYTQIVGNNEADLDTRLVRMWDELSSTNAEYVLLSMLETQ